MMFVPRQALVTFTKSPLLIPRPLGSYDGNYTDFVCLPFSPSVAKCDVIAQFILSIVCSVRMKCLLY